MLSISRRRTAVVFFCVGLTLPLSDNSPSLVWNLQLSDPRRAIDTATRGVQPKAACKHTDRCLRRNAKDGGVGGVWKPVKLPSRCWD